MDGFLLNFKFNHFSDIYLENSSFIKIGQEQRVVCMNVNMYVWSYLVQIFLEWQVFQKKTFSENQNTYFMFKNFFFRKSCRLWDNVEKYCRVGQATGDNMAHAHCMLDTKCHKHILKRLILIAFPLQHWLHEHSSVLHYTYTARLVCCSHVSAVMCSAPKMWTALVKY